MNRVYFYCSKGLEMRGVVHETASIVVIANKGVSGEIIPRSSVDNGDKYFTTPQLAIEDYVASCEAKIEDPETSEGWRKAYRKFILEAHARLTAALPGARTGSPAGDPAGDAQSDVSGARKQPSWSGRVGVNHRLIDLLNEYLESAFLSGYTQALIDNGLPADDVALHIEDPE